MSTLATNLADNAHRGRVGMRLPGFTAGTALRAEVESGSGLSSLAGTCVWRRKCVPLIACEGNACWVVRWICSYSVTCYP
jgi:hypothetical protein